MSFDRDNSRNSPNGKVIPFYSGGDFRPAKPFLNPETSAKLAWNLLPLADNLPFDEYRYLDGRYLLRWSRQDMMKLAGWRFEHGKFIAWESEING